MGGESEGSVSVSCKRRDTKGGFRMQNSTPIRRLIRAAAVMLVVVLAVSLVWFWFPPTSDSASATAVIATRFNPQSIDPAIDTTDIPGVLMVGVYEPLVAWDPVSNKLVPALASRWEVSSDGVTYTFEIRKGVKFHDGSTLTAKDVKVSLERIRRIGQGNSYLLDSVKGIRPLSNFKLQITLSRPFSPFVAGLPLIYIVSSKAVAKHSKGDDAKSWLRANEAGTGPYRLVAWTPNQEFVLEKFNEYWGGWSGKHITRYVVRTVAEGVTQLEMLRRGEVAYIDTVSVNDIPSITSDPNLVLESHAGISAFYFALNTAKGPLKEVRVRKAIRLAFDPRVLAEQVMNGQARVPAGIVPPSWPEHNSAIKPTAVNLAAAKRLLEEAGYAEGFKLTAIYYQPFDWERQAAVLWQNNLKQMGITLDLQGVPWPTLLQRLKDPKLQPDVVIYGKWIETASVDSLLWPMFHSKSTNWSKFAWSFPEVDRLLDQARLTVNSAKRKQIYNEVQAQLEELAPVVPLTITNDLKAIRRNLKGWVYNMIRPDAPLYYRWYIE